jgi:SAM-dependent methyltransferase
MQANNRQELERELARFPQWHYAIELAPGLLTPIRERVWINRHEQRLTYFWRPFVEAHPEAMRHARVLDLGCNAGFWTLQSLQAGAREVVAIDARKLHIDQFDLVMRARGVDRQRYQLRQANIFELDFASLGRFDTVLLLGLLYHVAKPMELFERIAMLDAQYLIIDTKVSRAEAPIIEVHHENLDDPRMAADHSVVFVPSSSAITMMLDNFGYDVERITPRFTDWEGAEDFRDGDRYAFICRRRATTSR